MPSKRFKQLPEKTKDLTAVKSFVFSGNCLNLFDGISL